MSRPVLVVSDLHLGPASPAGTGEALATLLRQYPSHELVLLGDIFDLSVEPAGHNPAEAAVRTLRAEAALVIALRERLAQGAPVTVIPGNHDAGLGLAGAARILRAGIETGVDAPIEIAQWFVRRHDCHLEHGHLWDPDNAPTHPAVPPSSETEPLGIAMMRRVLAPHRGLVFAHAHETTPLQGLTRAFREIGWHAPKLVASYYAAAIQLWWQARPERFAHELLKGEAELVELSRQRSVDEAQMRGWLAGRPAPRHGQASATFARLYLDRSLATVGLSLALPLGLALAPWAGLLTGTTAFGYLALSLLQGKDRYSGQFLEGMRQSALSLHGESDCRAVVFGHTHVEEAHPGYINTGSFGFAGRRGRPYLLLESGRFCRGWTGQSELASLTSMLAEPVGSLARELEEGLVGGDLSNSPSASDGSTQPAR